MATINFNLTFLSLLRCCSLSHILCNRFMIKLQSNFRRFNLLQLQHKTSCVNVHGFLSQYNLLIWKSLPLSVKQVPKYCIYSNSRQGFFLHSSWEKQFLVLVFQYKVEEQMAAVTWAPVLTQTQDQSEPQALLPCPLPPLQPPNSCYCGLLSVAGPALLQPRT